MEKVLSRVMLVLYLLVLIWLVLFKFSFNIAAFLDHQTGLNLIPFAASSGEDGGINFRELVDNCIAFIPFGLLLSVNSKKLAFKWKLTLIALFSLTVETIQHVFGIGASDITDLITNTLGGFLGLIVYDIFRKYSSYKTADRVIILTGIVGFSLFAVNIARLLLR